MTLTSSEGLWGIGKIKLQIGFSYLSLLVRFLYGCYIYGQNHTRVLFHVFMRDNWPVSGLNKIFKVGYFSDS